MDCKKNNKTPYAGRQQLSLITLDSWQVFKNIEISIIVYFLIRAFISSSHCVSRFSSFFGNCFRGQLPQSHKAQKKTLLKMKSQSYLSPQ